jgi:eukaryotic translation initiation factor 2C
MIAHMEDMMVTHLNTFFKNTKTRPEKILMFRDGVSEGQYGQVVE